MKGMSENRNVRTVISGIPLVSLGPPRGSRTKYRLLNALFHIAGVLLFVGSDMPVAAGQDLTYSLQRPQGSYGEVQVHYKASITVVDLNLVRYRYEIRRQVEALDAPNTLNYLRQLCQWEMTNEIQADSVFQNVNSSFNISNVGTPPEGIDSLFRETASLLKKPTLHKTRLTACVK